MILANLNAFLTQWVNWIAIVLIIVLLAILQFAKRLPSREGAIDMIGALNSRGGNILVLAGLSIWFFQVGMKFMYYLIEMVSAKKLDDSNSLAMLGIQWITGAAFGGAFGALLKTMTGDNTMSIKALSPAPVESPKTEAAPVAPEQPKP